MPRNLRKRTAVSYYESEETSVDEDVFCNECEDFVYEYCSIHGPPLVIPDQKVLPITGVPALAPTAALTIPNVFLHLARSVIPGAGIGVFSTLTLPRGVRFGPYRGVRTTEVESMYCWQLYDGNKRRTHVIDAADASRSNWMRYVNCARHWREQNLVAYQYQGQIYYSTIKTIPKFTELLVFYGSEFANILNIDLKKYNDEKHYKYIIGTTMPAEVNNQRVNLIDKYDSNSSADNLETQKVKSENVNNIETQTKFQTNKTTANKFDFQDIFNNDFNIQNDYFDMQSSNFESERNGVKQGRFVCEKCNKYYSAKKNLTRHILSHSTVKKYSCSFCGYKTNFNYLLKHHIRVHTKEIIFKCEMCAFSTHSRESVRRHLKSHNK